MAQWVKNSLTKQKMQETQIRSLDQEDVATHFSILA